MRTSGIKKMKKDQLNSKFLSLSLTVTLFYPSRVSLVFDYPCVNREDIPVCLLSDKKWVWES